MAVIKNFLYDSLSYMVTTGVSPVVVNNQVYLPKISMPTVQWSISFGNIKSDLANFIQNMIWEDVNNLYLASNVFPSMKLFKVTGGVSPFYTYRYTHEEVFYGGSYYDITNRKLSFTTDGTSDFITDGDLIITIASIGTISLENKRVPHYVHFTDGTFKLKHTAMGIVDTSAMFTEYFTPTLDTLITGTGQVITYVGRSNASDSGIL
jgi:hypothetical protein